MGIVAAMENSVPLSRTEQDNTARLVSQAFAYFAADMRRWFLPHLLGGIGIFLLVAYATSSTLFAQWAWPLKGLGMGCVLIFYGAVAFGYSLFTTGVLAVRLACVQWNHLIDKLLDLVQQKAAGQISNMDVGLSKDQAKTVVSGSVREVVSSFHRQQDPVFTRALAVLVLGLLGAALRGVLTAKVVKWSGKTIKLGKLFAGKATLAGAVFLNLHFFATLLLLFCYALGAGVLLLNIYFVFLLK